MRLVGVLVSLVVLCASPVRAHARRVEDEWSPFIADPFPPPVPPVVTGPAPIDLAGLRARLAGLDDEVAACVRQHSDAPPRTLRVHVFVYATGEWSIALGRVASAPLVGARGETPLEVCVADWVASEIGSRIEPTHRRRPVDVARTVRLGRD